MKTFDSLTEQEILALAISLEEEDARIYEDFADGLQENYPEQAEKFRVMRREEDGHRHRLLELYKSRFGDHVPLIRRQDVRGFVDRKPVWLVRPLGLKTVQKTAESMEVETKRFYEVAGRRTTDTGIRQLLGDLAEEERNHAHTAERITLTKLSEDEKSQQKRLFLLQVIQPGLAGLMDGSVSTLAPLFAAAFATHNSWETFLVGLAASSRRGHQHGFCRGVFRRRQPHRPRPSVGARLCVRVDDHAGRPRPHAAVFDSEFENRHRRRRGRGAGGTGHHLVDSPPVHGHAVGVGVVPGRAGRRAGFSGGNFDREFVNVKRDS